MNSNEESKKEGPRCGGKGWKIPFIIAAVVLIKSGVVLLLWNVFVPDVFNGPVLTYLQALELTVLVKLLTGFGPFRPGGFGGFRHSHARWMAMTPEERQKLREEMHKRCGH